MQEIAENKLIKETIRHSSPSLLRQLVDAIDEMDEGAKKLLLLTLKKMELSEKYAMLDEEIAKSREIMTEAEIAKLATDTRKEMYEQKIRP